MTTLSKAISWIAANDEPTWTDPAHIADMITTALVAEIFQTSVGIVARRVASIRLAADAPVLAGAQAPEPIIRSALRKIAGTPAAEWPEDDWLTLSPGWDLNLFLFEDAEGLQFPRATLYPADAIGRTITADGGMDLPTRAY